jgi:hypothetical protein
MSATVEEMTVTGGDAAQRRGQPGTLSSTTSADWIHTAVLDVFGVLFTDRDAAARVCEALIWEPDERVRRGAEPLIAMLVRIDPAPTAQQTRTSRRSLRGAAGRCERSTALIDAPSLALAWAA